MQKHDCDVPLIPSSFNGASNRRHFCRPGKDALYTYLTKRNKRTRETKETKEQKKQKKKRQSGTLYIFNLFFPDTVL
jgi:hypothetical protein